MFFSCNTKAKSPSGNSTQIPFIEIQTQIPSSTEDHFKAHLLDYAMLGNDFDHQKNIDEYKHICRPDTDNFSADSELPSSIQPKYAIVEVHSEYILLSGEKILELDNFQIPSKKGPSFLVTELYQAFQDLVSPRKQFSRTLEDESCRFTGSILFVFPKETPFELQRTIFFNAGQAEFSEFHLLVQPKDKESIVQEKALQGFFWVKTQDFPPKEH